jgi:hypothetical protein
VRGMVGSDSRGQRLLLRPLAPHASGHACLQGAGGNNGRHRAQQSQPPIPLAMEHCHGVGGPSATTNTAFVVALLTP